MNKFEDEITYGISIDGQLPCMWSEKYPTKELIDFSITSRDKSVEIVEKISTYEPIEKIR